MPASTDPGAQPDVILYCDGACSPNPGTGGWACVLISPARNLRREIFGAAPDTTNNRMELQAALEGLRALKGRQRVRIVTDSEYLKNAFTNGWLENWERNGWRTAAKKPVKNDDLWRELQAVMQQHDITWAWVRGHAGDVENTRCDELAVQARLKYAESLV